jgi:hypothetical protein
MFRRVNILHIRLLAHINGQVAPMETINYLQHAHVNPSDAVAGEGVLSRTYGSNLTN